MEIVLAKGALYGGFVLAIVAGLKSMIGAINGWRTLIPVVLCSAAFAWGDRALVTPTPDLGVTAMVFVATVAAAIGVNLTIMKAAGGAFPSMKVNKNGSDT